MHRALRSGTRRSTARPRFRSLAAVALLPVLLAVTACEAVPTGPRANERCRVSTIGTEASGPDGTVRCTRSGSIARWRVVAAPAAPVATPPISAEEAQVLDLANAERARAGLPALAHDGRLSVAAQRQADDNARTGQLSHSGTDGSGVGDRITQAGYPWRVAAENAAMGQGSPAEAVAGWLGSAGHRANLLNGEVTHAGMGTAVSPSGARIWFMVYAASF